MTHWSVGPGPLRSILVEKQFPDPPTRFLENSVHHSAVFDGIGIADAVIVVVDVATAVTSYPMPTAVRVDWVWPLGNASGGNRSRFTRTHRTSCDCALDVKYPHTHIHI